MPTIRVDPTFNKKFIKLKVNLEEILGKRISTKDTSKILNVLISENECKIFFVNPKDRKKIVRIKPYLE